MRQDVFDMIYYAFRGEKRRRTGAVCPAFTPKSWTKWTPKTPELRQFFRGYSTAERIVARDCEKFHNVYGRRAGVYNYLERMCNCCTLTIYNNSGACAVS